MMHMRTPAHFIDKPIFSVSVCAYTMNINIGQQPPGKLAHRGKLLPGFVSLAKFAYFLGLTVPSFSRLEYLAAFMLIDIW